MRFLVIISYLTRGCLVLGGILLSGHVATVGKAGGVFISAAPSLPTGVDSAPGAVGNPSLSVLYQRMPFRANRLPARQATVRDNSGGIEQPPDSVVGRVTGIVAGARIAAIIEDVAGAARSVAVREGDSVGSWFVRRITAEGVVLERSDRVAHLALPAHVRKESQ